MCQIIMIPSQVYYTCNSYFLWLHIKYVILLKLFNHLTGLPEVAPVVATSSPRIQTTFSLSHSMILQSQ